MSQHDRTRARRIATFIVIVMAHLAIGLFLIASTKMRFMRLNPRSAELVFLPVVEKREAAQADNLSAKAAPAARLHPPQPARQPENIEPDNAITMPNVDWDSEAQASIARGIQKQEMQSHRRNLSGPSDSELEKSRSYAPIAPDHHSIGDTERVAGGEVVTWVGEKCFWTTKGIAMNGMPETTKVCKDPPKPETELFKDVRKRLDEMEALRVP